MDWGQLISTIGFPIVSALGLFFGLKYQYDKDREERIAQDKRYDEIALNLKELCTTQSELSKAVNNNTEAILKLINSK